MLFILFINCTIKDNVPCETLGELQLNESSLQQILGRGMLV